MKQLLTLSFILCHFSLFCSEKTKADLEQQGQDKLEDCFEDFGLGFVGMGIGIFQFYKGDPVGGAVGIGAGIKNFKDCIDDFNEAREAFDLARETEDN